jgi:DNA invertase Pin-like site-specific DNA recombinase
MKEEKLKFGTYIRKSSEAEDRQAQSIPDQIRDIEVVIGNEKLNVVKRFAPESQSAHSPGRPIFADLVKHISDGIINAIIVWHPNRLARNPVDAGMLLYLMDIGKLKEIRALGKTYRNTASDKFMLQLEFGMSKKDSDDKSEVVKRALVGRAKRGLPNGVAHIGYTNDQTKEKGNRGWLQDKVRYPLVKQILTMMLTGKYSVRELHIYARDVLKLTTPTRKRQGGKPIALSYMYTLLKDPIHAGFFFQESDGEPTRFDFNAFEPMITEEEYWKIQGMLGAKGKTRLTKREATYHRFATCGTCNGMLSPDFKFQVICSRCKKKFAHMNRKDCPSCHLAIDKMTNPTYLSYVFYYCINDKKHRTSCPKSGIEEKNLEAQLVDDMGKNSSSARNCLLGASAI